MEKYKVFLSSPILTQSGYGEHSRFIYRALKSREDLFDIYAEAVPWGTCRWLSEDTEERREFDKIVKKTHDHIAEMNGNPYWDVSVEVKIPNEWKPNSLVNIGVTSGIETTKVLPQWNASSDMMDLIIVESEHAKSCFDTITPIEVISFPERSKKEWKDINLPLETDFNFLLVSQTIPRKNVQDTIIGFLEEFKNNENVGLVAKLSMGRDSAVEKIRINNILKSIAGRYPDRKCKIYFVFGYLKEEEISSFYHNDKIKAMVTMTKGEGFGLPLFEAACNGMPIIAPMFGGHKDFLSMEIKKKNKLRKEIVASKVDYKLGNLLPQDAWPNIMDTSQKWAYPSMASYRMKLRSLYKNYGAHKKKAIELQKHLMKTLDEENQNKKIVDVIYKTIQRSMGNEIE